MNREAGKTRGGGGTGRPHARGIPWPYRHAAGQPRRCTWGVVKSPEPHLAYYRLLSHAQTFFWSSEYSNGWAKIAGTDRLIEASRATGDFDQPNATPSHFLRLASLIHGASRIWFAIRRRGRIISGLFFHFLCTFQKSMFYKGTMGTWEQSMSNRQKASPLEGANLFPSHRTVLGTWEQKWPIPKRENPRACGYPLPPPVGERH